MKFLAHAVIFQPYILSTLTLPTARLSLLPRCSEDYARNLGPPARLLYLSPSQPTFYRE